MVNFMNTTLRHGINRRSSLLDIPMFSMFGGGLPHDIMHDDIKSCATVSYYRTHAHACGMYKALNNPGEGGVVRTCK